MYAVVASQVQRHAAEAEADIEHALAGSHVEPGGDMSCLGQQRSIKGYDLGGEVGAGVLHVIVKEEAIEVGVMIVVVMDVAPCPAGQVDDGAEPRDHLEPPLEVGPAAAGGDLLVYH